MAGDPCDLACKTKIIINGDNVAKIVETLCEQIEYAREHNIPILKGPEIIHQLNIAEDAVCKAQALFLRGIGYNGEVGHMLQP